MLIAVDCGAMREFRQVRLKSFPLRGEREALEEIGGNGYVGPLGKPHPLLLANHGEQFAPTFFPEKVLQPDIEDHGDAGQGGKGRDHLAVFQLGKHGRRQSRVLPEVYQCNLLAQAELPEFSADFVGGQNAADGFRAGFLFH
jgi:hypothetical protein